MNKREEDLNANAVTAVTAVNGGAEQKDDKEEKLRNLKERRKKLAERQEEEQKRRDEIQAEIDSERQILDEEFQKLEDKQREYEETGEVPEYDSAYASRENTAPKEKSPKVVRTNATSRFVKNNG